MPPDPTATQTARYGQKPHCASVKWRPYLTAAMKAKSATEQMTIRRMINPWGANDR